ncbi:MAG: response regulator [Anaerolineae bacterium]|nr:response regulator [Anaerolineae bacterium]
MSVSVLIVDDEFLTRNMLSIMLAQYGHQVIEAEDGIEALEMLQQNRPDIILMDLMMPRCDGITATKSIRKNNNLTDLPIIFLSAKTDSVTIQAGLDAGANRFLTKPVSYGDLVRNIQEVLVN